jgi:hypothetical protein
VEGERPHDGGQEGEQGAGVLSPAPRASVPVALGSMLLLALTVTGGLVAWMRAADPAVADRPNVGLEEEVPAELADGGPPGEVPEAIASAVEGQVVAVRELDELPAGASGCGMDIGGDMELEHATMTPDGLSVSFVGEAPEGFFEGPVPQPLPPPPPPRADPDEPQMDAQPVPAEIVEPFPVQATRWRETCVLRPRGGGWASEGSSSGPADDPFGGMGTSVTCCDPDGFATASSEVLRPDGATWALQHRGAYWLAYPVGDRERLVLTWRFREAGFGRVGSTTQVLWVDDGGTVLADQHLHA